MKALTTPTRDTWVSAEILDKHMKFDGMVFALGVFTFLMGLFIPFAGIGGLFIMTVGSFSRRRIVRVIYSDHMTEVVTCTPSTARRLLTQGA